jgi:hypothetical protein
MVRHKMTLFSSSAPGIIIAVSSDLELRNQSTIILLFLELDTNLFDLIEYLLYC